MQKAHAGGAALYRVMEPDHKFRWYWTTMSNATGGATKWEVPEHIAKGHWNFW